MNTGNTKSGAAVRLITAERVSEDAQRMEVLPRHFGKYMLRVEDAVYQFARLLVSDYRGGLWHFYELSNGGFYMVPDLENVRVRVKTNGYEGRMSADAAGITVCLYAFSQLALETRNDVLVRHYYLLRDFVLEHVEAKEILAAID